MKKIVALVLSLVMALSLATVAFAVTLENGDKLYDKMGDSTADPATEYTYVVTEYKASKDLTNWVPYVKDANNAYYKLATSGSTPLYKKGEATGLYLGDKIPQGEDGGLRYNYQAKEVAEAKWSCTTDAHKAGYVYTDENNATKYAVKKDGGNVKLLVDGKVITASNLDADTGYVAGQHLLYADTVMGKEVGVGVYEATCAACKQVIKFQRTNVTGGNYLYQDMDSVYADFQRQNLSAAKPAGQVWVTGGIYIIGAANTTPDKTGVNSAKTFDAGVAMYVGMSLLSVAGGAVVIGKKKEF